MGAIHGKSSVVMKDGFNLSLYLQDIEFSRTIGEAEKTTLSSTAKEFIPGLGETTLSGNGFYDGEVLAVDEVLEAALLLATNTWTHFPNGDTKGNRGKAISGIHTTYSINNTFDDLVKISFAGRGNTALYSVVSLQPLATISTTTTTTGVDNTIQTTSGGQLFIQVEAVTGTIDYQLQDSADNINFADIGTGSLSTDSVSQIDTIAGTIRRYTRLVLTLGGGESIKAQFSLNRG